MTCEAYPAFDPREPDFERGPERTRQHHGNIESGLLPQDFDCAEQGTFGDWQNGVHFRDQFPNRRDLGRRRDGDVRVRPPGFDGPDRGDGDDAVPKPVWPANQDPEGLKLGLRHSWWNESAALIIGEEEIWPRSFPSVMDPEPILRSDADLTLEGVVAFGGDRRHRIAGGIQPFAENHAPFARSDGVRGARDNC